ncbi:hypothetical protein AMTRI_Chr05g58750 [Amborella trichopoda]
MVPNSDLLLITLIHLSGIFCVIRLVSLKEFLLRLLVEACLVVGLWCESWVSMLELWWRTMVTPAIQRLYQRFQSIVE